jgi:hypothetical protein
LPTLSLISRSKAETDAAAQLQKAQQDLVVASRKLNSVKDRLAHLSMEDVIDVHGQDWISSATYRMNNLDDQVQALMHEFHQVAEEPAVHSFYGMQTRAKYQTIGAIKSFRQS